METDEQLMIRAQQGDRSAFGELVDRYENLVYTICYRMLGHEADAKNYTQQTFLQAWENRGSFDPERALKPWLCRIASNECAQYLRKASTRYENPGVEHEPANGSGASAEKQLEQAELRNEIQAGLKELNPEYRRLILMKYVGDCSYKELAGELELSVSAVEAKLHRARRKLREQLQNLSEEFLND